MSYRDNVEVIRRAIVLVILGTSQEFLVVHVPKVGSLNRIVGIEDVGDPVLAVVVSMSCYLHFISYAVSLASFCPIVLDLGRLSSCIVSWVQGSVSLNVGSIGCIVDDIVGGIGWSFCRCISCRIGWSVSCSVGSGVDRLHNFVFASSLFSHQVEGTLAAATLARPFRSNFGVGTSSGSDVSWTTFFDLSSGDADVGLKTSYLWRVFEVV
jgi:hypothetical protein